MQKETKQTINLKLFKLISTFLCLSICLVSLFSISIGIDYTLETSKPAAAAGPNTSNLIIGTTDNGTTIDVSVCLQATPGPIHITNSSVWLKFDPTALTTTAGAITKGQYGNSNNGYGVLKWQQVPGNLTANSDQYSMSLFYAGDNVTPGINGLSMSTTPELFGKVTFTKVAGSTSPLVQLTKNVFFSTENFNLAIVQTVSNVTGDCTGVAATTSSSSSSSVSSSSSTLSSSSSSTSNSSSSNSSSSVVANNGGGGVIVICAATCPRSSVASLSLSSQSSSSSQLNAVVASNQTGIFKSKLHVTDPYVCGQGAYGNVMSAKQNGVDYVYYEFYKEGSTTTSYNYKLKMNADGDFFLPISKTTNVIADGMYKVVFYAYDSEGNKAQGDYKAYIASDCTGSNIVRSGNGSSVATIRTGGLQFIQLILVIASLLCTYYIYKLSKPEEIKFKI
jgi:hypothetical protein